MQLHHMFFKSVSEHRDKIAIYDQATKMDLSYGKVCIAAFMLSSHFKQHKETYIGIMLPSGSACTISILAALIAGKIPVMINYSTGAENNCLVAQEKCAFKTIVTAQPLLDNVKCDHIDGMIYVEKLLKEMTLFDKIKALIYSKTPTTFAHKGNVEDTAVILFTTGSEKTPKAVQLSHKNISSNVESLRSTFNVTSKDVLMSVLPNFHVFGINTGLWLPIISGSSCVTHANPLDLSAVPASVKKYEATIMTATPTFYAGYLRKASKNDFASVRLLIAGGDKVPHSLVMAYKEEQNAILLEGYGCTETSPVIACNHNDNYKIGSTGLVVDDVKVKIVGVDTYEDLPIGQIGKILVKGNLVMKGYLGDFEETSMRIRNGWYDTGDMGCFDDDGFLWHKGRLKRFVKIGGEMISLTALEVELEKILPPDVEGCAAELSHPTKGAEIVVAVTGEIDRKKIRKKLLEVLPKIALPTKYYIIDEMPMMGNGKINFKEVQKFCTKKAMEKTKK